MKEYIEQDSTLINSFLGVAVFDTEKDSLVFGYNKNKNFVPASNVKLFTLLSAVTFLEDKYPSYQYRYGGFDSIIFWGCGDISFLNEQFQGITKTPFLDEGIIGGRKIFFSLTNHKDSHYGRGWMWDDLTLGFSPYKHPLSINGNSIVLSYEKKSRNFTVFPQEIKKYVRFDNTKYNAVNRETCSNDISINPKKIHKKTNKVPLIFRERYFLDELKNHYKIDAEFANVSHSPSLKHYYSLPLDTVLTIMMKKSDNFLAEQILYAVGCKLNLQLSTSLILQHLQDTLFSKEQYTLKWVDGSGISRYNLASPMMFIDVLKKLRATVQNDSKLFSYMSIAGKDGTLKKLLHTDKAFLFGKSGTLSGVYNLSGYILTENNKLLLVSIMTNNYIGKKKSILKNSS